MKRTGLHIIRFPLFMIALAVTGVQCSKTPPFQQTDPETGLPPAPLTTVNGECLVVKIAQKNSGTGADNAFEIKRDAALNPTAISSYDRLAKKIEYNITVQKTSDSISLSTGEYFLLDKTTKQVAYFSTRADLQDPAADRLLFQYVYDASGYLVKKYQYINGSNTADYETNYTYTGGVLTGCTILAGKNKVKLLQSTLEYDKTTERKSWLYLFPDFFESYKYMQALPFGKKSTYPVKSIVTNIFDVSDNSILDTWNTQFSGYVYSADNFILQTTAKGDLQQGLGLLFGTTRFGYQCDK